MRIIEVRLFVTRITFRATPSTTFLAATGCTCLKALFLVSDAVFVQALLLVFSSFSLSKGRGRGGWQWLPSPRSVSCLSPLAPDTVCPLHKCTFYFFYCCCTFNLSSLSLSGLQFVYIISHAHTPRSLAFFRSYSPSIQVSSPLSYPVPYPPSHATSRLVVLPTIP